MAFLKTSIFNRPIGSVGDITFTERKNVNGGYDTVASHKPETRINPHSYGQSYQRALIAMASKAYRAFPKGFFEHAFEDRRENESAFDAFMRHNVSRAVILPRTEVKSPVTPPLMFSCQISQGSLPTLCQPFVDESPDYSIGFPFVCDGLREFAVGLTGLGFKNGDVVTAFVIGSNYPVYSDFPIVSTNTYAPIFSGAQWILNTHIADSEYNIKYFGTRAFFPGFYSYSRLRCLGWLDFDVEDSQSVDVSKWYNVVIGFLITRPLSHGKVLTSTSYLYYSPYVRQWIDHYNEYSQIITSLKTWGYTLPPSTSGTIADGDEDDPSSYGKVYIVTIRGEKPPLRLYNSLTSILSSFTCRMNAKGYGFAAVCSGTGSFAPDSRGHYYFKAQSSIAVAGSYLTNFSVVRDYDFQGSTPNGPGVFTVHLRRSGQPLIILTLE